LFADKDVIYNHYTRWCEKNNEQKLAFNRFKEKLSHYNSTIVYKKVKVDAVGKVVFTFPINFFQDEDDKEEGDNE
jgi:hypothetical protein